ncbi:MAG: hypothetical protein NXI32_09680 [bacterium]|nr:hypothetical protein [bacterium]
MKITYSVAASQDGFIARDDGDVSWLDEMALIGKPACKKKLWRPEYSIRKLPLLAGE